MKTDRIYRLGESTEIFFNGDTEIIFRKGVWNYEEALLDLTGFDEAVQENEQELSSQEEQVQSMDEKETQDVSAPADTLPSKEDEWLYSEPRRFAKKPEDQQKD